MFSPGPNSYQIILYLSLQGVNLIPHGFWKFSRRGSFHPQHDDPIKLAGDPGDALEMVELGEDMPAAVEANHVGDDIEADADEGVGAESLGDAGDVRLPGQADRGRKDHHTDEEFAHQGGGEEVAAQDEGLNPLGCGRVGKPGKQQRDDNAGPGETDECLPHVVRPHTCRTEDMDGNFVDDQELERLV